jgi:hypothetical protein
MIYGGDNDLGMRLFLAMAGQGLTLKEAAERSGITADRLGEFCWNCAKPGPDEVQLLVEGLGVALEDDESVAEFQPPSAPSQVDRSLEAIPVVSVAAGAVGLYERALARIDQFAGCPAGSDEARDLARLIEIVEATRPPQNGPGRNAADSRTTLQPIR